MEPTLSYFAANYSKGGGPSYPPFQPPLSPNNLVLQFKYLINMCIGWCCPG